MEAGVGEGGGNPKQIPANKTFSKYMVEGIQTAIQHVSAFEAEGEEGRKKYVAQWRTVSQRLAKKRRGEDLAKDDTKEPIKKRRRTKAFLATMSLNNQLKQLEWDTLKKMKPSIDVKTENLLGSHFDWPHLNLSTDMGPDMICMLFLFNVLVGLKPVDRFRPPHQHLHDLTLPYYSYPILFSSPHYPTLLPHRFPIRSSFLLFSPRSAPIP